MGSGTDRTSSSVILRGRSKQSGRRRACDYCRRKKLRCDSLKVVQKDFGPGLDVRCNNCKAAKGECTYIEEHKSKTIPKAYITDLKRRHDEIARVFDRHFPAFDHAREVGPPINPPEGDLVPERYSKSGDQVGVSTHAVYLMSLARLGEAIEQVPSKATTPYLQPDLKRPPTMRVAPGAEVEQCAQPVSAPSHSVSADLGHPAFYARNADTPLSEAYSLFPGSRQSGDFCHWRGQSRINPSNDILKASNGYFCDDAPPPQGYVRDNGKALAHPRHASMHSPSSFEFVRENRLLMQNVNTRLNTDLMEAGSRSADVKNLYSVKVSMRLNRRKNSQMSAEDLLELAYPPTDLLYTLIDLYFRHINIFWPLLLRPIFEADLLAQRHKAEVDFGCVVLAVCAVASRYCADSRVLAKAQRQSVRHPDSTRSPLGAPWEGSNPWIDDLEGRWQCSEQSFENAPACSAGWKYYDRIQRYRPNVLAPITLPELQTTCLMHQFLLGLPNSFTGYGWVMVGAAIHKAQDQGAHLKRRCGGSTLETEMWKRAFWYLVVADRLTSAVLGRVPCVRDEDVDAELPLEIDDEFWFPRSMKGHNPATIEQPAGRPSKITAFNVYAKLSLIYAWAMRTFYAIDRRKLRLSREERRQEGLCQLSRALGGWLASVPPHLKWDQNQSNPVWRAQSANLYLTYYQLQMDVYRCTDAARSSAQILKAQLSSLNSAFMTGFTFLTVGAIRRRILQRFAAHDEGIGIERSIDDVHDQELLNACAVALQVVHVRWLRATSGYNMLMTTIASSPYEELLYIHAHPENTPRPTPVSPSGWANDSPRKPHAVLPASCSTSSFGPSISLAPGPYGPHPGICPPNMSSWVPSNKFSHVLPPHFPPPSHNSTETSGQFYPATTWRDCDQYSRPHISRLLTSSLVPYQDERLGSVSDIYSTDAPVSAISHWGIPEMSGECHSRLGTSQSTHETTPLQYCHPFFTQHLQQAPNPFFNMLPFPVGATDDYNVDQVEPLGYHTGWTYGSTNSGSGGY